MKEGVESTSTCHILNLGVGVHSTVLFLMFLNGGIDQKLDFAIFADTQEEPDSVYEHLDRLRSLGGLPILADTAGKLGDDLIHGKNSTGQRFASIPAFTSPTPGQTGGMLRRQCTAEYNIDVCERITRRQVVGLEPRQRIPEGVRIVQYFGLSYDEPRRVGKVKYRIVDHPWAEGRFPLFDLAMTRGDFPPSYVPILETVGTLRNKMSDAHGRGPKPLYKVGKEHADHMIQITSAHITFVVKQAGL